MTDEGTYKSLDLGELQTAFDQLPEEARLFRVTTDHVDLDEYIYRASLGPVTTSTTQTLVCLTDFPIWDVNGYYRAMGIRWPYQPTRKQMRVAYQESDGQRSAWVSYAFKRLLDKTFRPHYDRRPLGHPVDDDYRWEELRRMASEFARKQSLATGDVVTVRDILGEDMARRMEAHAEAERQEQGIADKRDETSDETSRDRPEAEMPFLWMYAFYSWRSRMLDDLRLSRWQQMIVSACAKRGLSMNVAVGYVGGTPAAAARVRHFDTEGGEYVQVLFLHENHEPTQALADVVVGTYDDYPESHNLLEPLYLQDPQDHVNPRHPQ